jgi:heat shock protein beta
VPSASAFKTLFWFLSPPRPKRSSLGAIQVEEEEYQKFWKALSKSDSEPMAHSHFRAEGDVEFKSILFIPPTAPSDLYDNYHSRSADLKLYVRRVFISDEFEELVPKYLSFLKGIVDSDSLPLNVSREMLQQHSSLKTIKKKLVRKALDMIRKLAEGDDDEDKDKEEGEQVEDDGADEEVKESKYEKFWKEYGKAIKLGVIEDSSNRTRLAKLLRFYTSKSGDKLTSLEEYVGRMKEGQKQIYYLAGNSMDEVKNSAFLERLLAKDLEVIFFTDPIDEYLMQNLTEFDDKKFANASKEDLKFDDKDDDEKAREKKVKEQFKDLTKWWKSTLTTEEVCFLATEACHSPMNRQCLAHLCASFLSFSCRSIGRASWTLSVKPCPALTRHNWKARMGLSPHQRVMMGMVGDATRNRWRTSRCRTAWRRRRASW